MTTHRDRRLVTVLSFLLLMHTAGVSAQSSTDDAAPDTTRLELILDLRTVVISLPSLSADDPAHRPLLSTMNDGAAGRVRIAQVEVDAPLEIGMLDLEVEEHEPGESASVSTFGVALSRTNSGWSLEVATVDRETSTPAIVGTVPLVHGISNVSASRLIGSLTADGSDDALLTLRWGRHTWSTGLRLPVPREEVPRARRSNGVAEARAFTFDSSALQRASRLSARNTNTVVLPDGTRFSTIYPKKLEVTGRDFAHLVSVKTDSVVRVIDGAVIRLETDVPLHFGDQVLDTGNVGLADSPGAYGVWLKRTADGWTLVFNDEPDAWGTQHDPLFDAAEVTARYVQSDLVDDSIRDATRALSTSVVMTGPDQGQFVLVWGPHEWTADFTVGS